MALSKRGSYWRYNFMFNGKKIQKSTKLTNRQAAKRAENRHRERLAMMEAGLPVPDMDEKPAIPTLSDYVPVFLQWSKAMHRKTTYKLHEDNCATLNRYLGGKRLDEITRADVEAFMVARSKESPINVALRSVRESESAGMQVAPPPRSASAADSRTVRTVRVLPGLISPATVNRAVTTLKKIFGQAEGAYPSLHNPCRGVELLPEGEVQRIFSEEEWNSYLSAAEKIGAEDLRDVAILMRERGLRPQDACSLTCDQCDFDSGTVELWPKPEPRAKLVAVRVQQGKTANSSRAIDMSLSPAVIQILKARVEQARAQGTEYLFPMRVNGKIVSDRPRDPQSLNKPHRKALKSSGIRGRVRLYDARHTFATNAIRDGVNLRVVQDMLGHANPKTTMRYTQRNDLVAQRAAFARIEITQ